MSNYKPGQVVFFSEKDAFPEDIAWEGTVRLVKYFEEVPEVGTGWNVRTVEVVEVHNRHPVEPGREYAILESEIQGVIRE